MIRHFLNVMVYSLLLIQALWFGRRAVKAVGIYRFSRDAVTPGEAHECGDKDCPATLLISAMHETHLKVRTEAFWAVGTAVMTIAAAVFVFGLLMSRLA